MINVCDWDSMQYGSPKPTENVRHYRSISHPDAKSFLSSMIHLRHSWVLVLDTSALANLVLLLWSAGRTEPQLKVSHVTSLAVAVEPVQPKCQRSFDSVRIVNDHCRYLQLGTHCVNVSEDQRIQSVYLFNNFTYC